jgi:nucleotide-binding universal stress UspA family protein
MSYKTVLVHADESTHMTARVAIAADIAKQNDAHLIGAAATALPGTYYLPELIGESTVSLTAYLEYLRQRADGTLATFESIARQKDVRSFENRIINDEAGAGISMQARYSDLVVVGQTDPDESLPATQASFPEYVVMNSGRPVLIVPYAGEFVQIGKRVLAAWDGSMEATRAFTNAIPFLKRAELVQVAVFNPKARSGVHGEQPGADIALYLSRHGVKVEVAQHAATGDVDTGSALLSQAADFAADLIVMGCYGHSRFREVLLGGVSNTILRSMTVPVLMSH